jgi:hypothetical protein
VITQLLALATNHKNTNPQTKENKTIRNQITTKNIPQPTSTKKYGKKNI